MSWLLNSFVVLKSFASKALATASKPKSADLKNALDSLRSALNDGGDETACSISAPGTKIFVDVFIAFDEAHSLTSPFDEEDP